MVQQRDLHEMVQQRDALMSEIDDTVLRSLQRFCQASAFKRTAQQVVAFHLTSAEIGDMRVAFERIDEDCTGLVSWNEFISCVRTSIPDREEVREIFSGIDQAHTGRISYLEFLAATMQDRVFSNEGRLKQAFEKMDLDQSGYISIQNLQILTAGEYTEEEVRS